MTTEVNTKATDERYQANKILAVVLVGYLLIVLDLSIIFTGLPEIGRTLAMDTVTLSWVHNAYLLCFGGFLLLAARAGDLLGRKRMMLWGISLFTLSSLVIALSETSIELIGARAVQGIGASIMAPSVLSIISSTFKDGQERSRALAWYSMVAGGGASLGMVLGGLFAGYLSWRVGFLMNVPIGIFLWFAASRVLQESERRSGNFDLLGALTSTLGMFALVFGIVHAADYGWDNTLAITSIATAILLLASFLWLESRAEQPLVPLELFASRERSGAYLARLTFTAGAVSFFIFTTQFMQQVLGYTPLQAGLGFLPMTIPTFIAAIYVPRLTRIFGNGVLVCVAMGTMGAGLVWLSQAPGNASYWVDVAAPMILMGFGNGAALGPLTVAGVRGVDAGNQGAASGVVNVAHQMGGSLGLGVLVAVFAASASPQLSGLDRLAHQLSSATLGAGVSLILGMAVCIAFVLPADRSRQIA